MKDTYTHERDFSTNAMARAFAERLARESVSMVTRDGTKVTWQSREARSIIRAPVVGAPPPHHKAKGRQRLSLCVWALLAVAVLLFWSMVG